MDITQLVETLQYLRAMIPNLFTLMDGILAVTWKERKKSIFLLKYKNWERYTHFEEVVNIRHQYFISNFAN